MSVQVFEHASLMFVFLATDIAAESRNVCISLLCKRLRIHCFHNYLHTHFSNQSTLLYLFRYFWSFSAASHSYSLVPLPSSPHPAMHRKTILLNFLLRPLFQRIRFHHRQHPKIVSLLLNRFLLFSYSSRL